MLRGALLRGAASGLGVSVVGISKAVETGATGEGYYGPVIAVAVISGVTAVIVAMIYVITPRLLDRRKTPAMRESHDEAVDALVDELVRKEKEIQKLNRDIDRLRATKNESP